ncbi:hypothetical protein BC2903_59080 [Bacillus cereus]|nr:hypothetical protein BC2903_59080 [Bacillus cereus]GIX60273.1 hypothetical protein BPADB04_53030 [Bacillus paranthracis]
MFIHISRLENSELNKIKRGTSNFFKIILNSIAYFLKKILKSKTSYKNYGKI